MGRRTEQPPDHLSPQPEVAKYLKTRGTAVFIDGLIRAYIDEHNPLRRRARLSVDFTRTHKLHARANKQAAQIAHKHAEAILYVAALADYTEPEVLPFERQIRTVFGILAVAPIPGVDESEKVIGARARDLVLTRATLAHADGVESLTNAYRQYPTDSFLRSHKLTLKVQ